ncbi:fungal hydrophobin-domain-containing protein [Collybia nuda]|uniref:Hydrophobin n=1 Tax=Collybia nuda TaxID=64659 RepID=A0A9P6CJ02_9AGAR|nr:fungal hydrophobin-domain-containing protein [Collybia nuda]
MFSKVALLATLSLALSALAGSTKCNTGEIQCCQSLHQSQQEGVTKLVTLLGAGVQGVKTMVGTNCSPLSVVGVGSGASCTQQPVCCEENKFNGLIAIGCTPANIAL